jgi:4-diphosphocytidyl-2-C-methyl-D-erythritol kinase
MLHGGAAGEDGTGRKSPLMACVGAATVYRAYAKLNLYLAVIDRRPDGFHDIETVFQTVGLADEIRLSAAPLAVTLECNLSELEGEDNLALRAARLLRERHAPGRGAHLSLSKRIPVAAGLAGGSTDAAATLVGLNELWETGLSEAALQGLGAELGSDVPFLVRGGTVAGTGRGEVLRPLESIRESWFVLLHPPIEVSAGRVYNHAELRKSREERMGGITSSFEGILAAMSRGAIADVMYNAMEIPVFLEYPELAVLKQRLLDAGCAGALMSGSGPTLFGLCKDRAHAERIAARFTGVATSVVSTTPAGSQRVV